MHFKLKLFSLFAIGLAIYFMGPPRDNRLKDLSKEKPQSRNIASMKDFLELQRIARSKAKIDPRRGTGREKDFQVKGWNQSNGLTKEIISEIIDELPPDDRDIALSDYHTFAVYMSHNMDLANRNKKNLGRLQDLNSNQAVWEGQIDFNAKTFENRTDLIVSTFGIQRLKILKNLGIIDPLSAGAAILQERKNRDTEFASYIESLGASDYRLINLGQVEPKKGIRNKGDEELIAKAKKTSDEHPFFSCFQNFSVNPRDAIEFCVNFDAFLKEAHMKKLKDYNEEQIRYSEAIKSQKCVFQPSLVFSGSNIVLGQQIEREVRPSSNVSQVTFEESPRGNNRTFLFSSLFKFAKDICPGYIRLTILNYNKSVDKIRRLKESQRSKLDNKIIHIDNINNFDQFSCFESGSLPDCSLLNSIILDSDSPSRSTRENHSVGQ